MIQSVKISGILRVRNSRRDSDDVMLFEQRWETGFISGGLFRHKTEINGGSGNNIIHRHTCGKLVVSFPPPRVFP